MKTTALAAALLLGFVFAGTSQSAQAGPINALDFNIEASAQADIDNTLVGSDALLHTVNGFKKGHHGHRRHRSFGHRGFGRRGFRGHRGFKGHRGFGHRRFRGHRGFGHRSFGHGGFGHKSFGHGGFKHKDYGHHGGFGLFGLFFKGKH